MDQMGNYYQKTEQRFTDMEEKMEEWKEEIVHEFRIVAENIKHDFQGAFHDKLEQHENRIVRLESRVGLVT